MMACMHVYINNVQKSIMVLLWDRIRHIHAVQAGKDRYIAGTGRGRIKNRIHAQGSTTDKCGILTLEECFVEALSKLMDTFSFGFC